MNGNWRRMTLLALAAALALPTLLPAQTPDPSRRAARSHHGPGGMEWWNEPAVIEALGLDEATRQAIDEEVYRSQQEMITLRAEAERQSLDLQRVLRTQPADVDLDAVEAQVDRVVRARGAVMKEEILLRARIMALLTPEQRAQLEDRFQARRQRFRDRHPAPADPPAGPEEPR